MKKLFYLIVALMLVPALVACGATAAASHPNSRPSRLSKSLSRPPS